MVRRAQRVSPSIGYDSKGHKTSLKKGICAHRRGDQRTPPDVPKHYGFVIICICACTQSSDVQSSPLTGGIDRMDGHGSNVNDNASSDAERVRSLFQDLPERYGQRFLRLLKLRDLFLEEMALSLQPAVNQWLTEQQPDTATKKDALVTEVTDYLRMLNLAVRLPSSPDSGRLSVVEVGRQHDTKYTLESLRTGPRRSDPRFDVIPPLELMADAPKAERVLLALQRPQPDGRGR